MDCFNAISNLIKFSSEIEDIYDAGNQDLPDFKNNAIYISFGYSFGG